MLNMLIRFTVWGSIALALTHCRSINDADRINRLDSGGNTPGASRGNRAPEGADKTVLALESDGFSSQVTGTDGDEGQTLRFSLVTEPSHGTVELDEATGAFLYIPDIRYVGEDSFRYQISDGVELSGIYTVSLSVEERDFPWSNPHGRADVNGDGSVTALDALLVINRLNDYSGLSPSVLGVDGDGLFVDTNGNDAVTASDALKVINHMNVHGGGLLRCGPGAIEIEGRCWSVGSPGDSCNEVCAPRGGCSQDALTVVGGGASSAAACGALTEKFLSEKGIDSSDLAPVAIPSNSLGCSLTSDLVPVWAPGATSCGAKHETMRRLCPCGAPLE